MMQYRITAKSHRSLILNYGKIKSFEFEHSLTIAPGGLVNPEEHNLNELGDEFNLICTPEELDDIMLYVNGSALDKSNVSILIIKEFGKLEEF